MSTENLSVHFCHLQFLSSMSLGRSLTSVVKFIPRYYCVSGSVFLIPLLVYRTETNFVYVFISCNLLNLPINRYSLLLADSFNQLKSHPENPIPTPLNDGKFNLNYLAWSDSEGIYFHWSIIALRCISFFCTVK